MALQINSSVAGDTARLALGGRFDFTSQQQLRSSYEPPLRDDNVQTLELDLGNVEFLDSTALGLLLLLKERVTETGRKLAVTNCQGAPLLVLKMAHFDRLFDMRCSSDASICAFYSR